MDQRRTHSSSFSSRHTLRTPHSKRRDARIRLRYELLEPRHLLAGDLESSWSWFESFDEVPRIAPAALHAESRPDPNAMGPHDLVASEWIVQLTDDAIDSVDSIETINDLLDREPVDFTVITGLGSPGSVLLRGRSVTSADAGVALAENPHLTSHAANETVSGAMTLVPSDPDFGQMTGLNNSGQFDGIDNADVNAPEAWAITTGSTSVVVGVIDSGVDPTHPDLYLNIWLNQGEIDPALREQLRDIDGDQRITFYDLNNLRVNASGVIEVASTGIAATVAELTSATPFANGLNAEFVKDKNGNGRIDGIDLILDATWTPGDDTDGNGLPDDIIGWNFRDGTNDPSDDQFHGTHVAGTIGAIGNNGTGVVGLNWQTSIMPLKFLDQFNQGSVANAISAINYTTMMRTRTEDAVNIVATNNSWGQPGGFNPVLRDAIEANGEANMLFVAAAGNGNVLGFGVDNDDTPFYPASYELENIIAVAASDSRDKLWVSSNFGKESVDIAAPGVGIISTVPGDSSSNQYRQLIGTSMATPHVTGTAALINARLPGVNVSDVKDAIIASATGHPIARNQVSSNGRLDTFAALNYPRFAPRAELLPTFANVISQVNASPIRLQVEYKDFNGIKADTIGDKDIIVTHSATGDTFFPKWESTDASDPTSVVGSYLMQPPGVDWDPLDFGTYTISLNPNAVTNTADPNPVAAAARELGTFQVRIENERSIIVNTTNDTNNSDLSAVDGNISLRSAIQHLNQAGGKGFIFLDSKVHRLTLNNVLPEPNDSVGDLDIQGDITIVGSGPGTIIDAGGIDRVFDVFSGARLDVRNATITGGRASDHGGGIRVQEGGAAELVRVNVEGNIADRGGGIANFGVTKVNASIIVGNGDNLITLSGGGIWESSTGETTIFATTIEGNIGTDGSAIFAQGQMTIDSSTVTGHTNGVSVVAVEGTDAGTKTVIKRTTLSGNSNLWTVEAISGDLELLNTTYADNTGVNVVVRPESMVKFRDNLIVSKAGFDVRGPSDKMTSLGFNLLSSVEPSVAAAFVGPGDLIENDASLFLAPLADNGGPTQTHMLLPGSSAIDGGSIESVALEESARDQRGFASPRDGNGDRRAVSDIGAVERTFATVEGIVYTDHDTDRARDASEASVAGRILFLDRNQNGILDQGERFTQSVSDDPLTADVVETGRYRFDNVEPGTIFVSQVLENEFERTEMGYGNLERVSLQPDLTESPFESFGPSLSFDGRFVAYGQATSADESTARFLVHDRQTSVIEELPMPPGETGSYTQLCNGFNCYRTGDAPSISDDGFLVTFVASEIDGSGFKDVYLVDRRLPLIAENVVRISTPPLGGEADGDSDEPQLSGDGKFITFTSQATNLVDEDNNQNRDVFVYEVATQNLQRVSIPSRDLTDPDAEGNGPSYASSISGDGKTIVFISQATNLVTGDANESQDLFLVDRESLNVHPVTTVPNVGPPSQDGCPSPSEYACREFSRPSLSDDGQLIAFTSNAPDLSTRNGGSQSHIFAQYLYDRPKNEIEILNSKDNYPNPGGYGTAIDGTGNYVVFDSDTSVTPGVVVPSSFPLTFVAKLGEPENTFELISQSLNNQPSTASPDGRTLNDISSDGVFVAFGNSSVNLVDDDLNGVQDIFVRSTQQMTQQKYVTLEIFAGEAVTNLNFGSSPNPGEISGRVFQARSQLDEGIAGVKIFIDRDGDREFDAADEISTTSDLLGNYVFTDLPGFSEYELVAIAPENFEQVVPSSTGGGVLQVFLSAGGSVGNRDFGFAPANTGGQSSSGTLTIQGQLFWDVNEDGLRDAGESAFAVRTQVYLDTNDNGIRDGGLQAERRTETDDQGHYSFTNLPPGNYVVRTSLEDRGTEQQTSPKGNQFSEQELPLSAEKQAAVNAQDVVFGDFDGDGWQDIAVALYATSEVSIRLNQGDGTFTDTEIRIPLDDDPNSGLNAIGPTTLAAVKVDGDLKDDLIVVNNASSTATVLKGFVKDSNVFANSKFSSTKVYAVGVTPLGLATGDFDGVDGIDFAVTNSSTGMITVMLNNGSGAFTMDEDKQVSTGGVSPTSLVAGFFDSDTTLDLAVANLGSNTVGVLLGQADGSFTFDKTYEVGNLPIAITAGDFNDDGSDDLAVVNFGSNTVSILKGNGTSFEVLSDQLSVGKGPLDIASADINDDGAQDILVTNLTATTQQVLILRGVPNRGEFAFEPAESFGVAEISTGERSSFAVGDLNGVGDDTRDLVTVSSIEGVVKVLNNDLVDGAHRIVLAADASLNFGIKARLILPSLDPIADPLPIIEDSLEQSIDLTGIAKGRENTEAPWRPELKYNVTTSNEALIPIPTVTHVDRTDTATLNYTPKPDANGTAVITVTVIDAGADAIHGTADDAELPPQTFTITVLSVNDPPVFNLMTEVSAKQKGATQPVPEFITGLGNGGGTDEDLQPREQLVVTATDPSFFTTQPAIDATGVLTFTPNPDKSGSVPVTVTLKDSGGRANGGVDTTTKTFVINVLPVNDQPSFTLTANPNLIVLQTAGKQTIDGFVNSFLPGGGSDEATQSVSDYIVTVDAPGIFSVLPDISDDGTISNTGTLTFAPAVDRTGVATVSVQVRDNGGRANGGVDLSTAQTFTITVTPVPDTTRPTPVISTVVPSLTNQETFDVEIDFREPLAAGSFTIDDVTVSSGEKKDFRDDGNGKYRIAYTSSGDGEVTFGVAENVATDVAGNRNLVAENLVVVIDRTALVPTFSSTIGARTNFQDVMVSLDFGKAVTDLTLSDFSLTNATASDLIAIDARTGKYSLKVLATADGPVNVQLVQGVVTDSAGTLNSPSNVLSWTLDRTAPTATLTLVIGGVGQPVREVEVAFSEPVTGFDPSDLVVQGGTPGAIVRSRDNTLFNVSITPTGDGALLVQLPAASVKDLTGLDNAAAISNTVTVDISRPVPTLSGAAGATSGTFAVTISFTESVTGLTSNDFQVTNATLSQLSGSGSSYTAMLTAINQGELTITLPEERVTDVAGNRNVDSNVLTLTHSLSQTSIVLTAGGETLDMATQTDEVLSSVTSVDIRGTGRNSLVLEAAKIAALTPNRTLLVIADQGDAIDFGDGWQFDSVQAVDGRLHRLFTNGAATVRVIGPLDWTNPFIAGDVNGSGDVTAGDALDILFSLNQPQLFDSRGNLVDAATVTPSNFRFYDTNEDGMSTAADALFVINVLFLQSLGGSGEGESAPVQSALLSQRSSDEDDHNVTLSVEQLDLGISSKVKTFGRNDVAVPVAVAGDIDSEVGDPSEEFGDIDAILASVLNWSL